MERHDYDDRCHSSALGSENVGGVNVYPTPITVGENVNIVYDGLLHKSGAREMYLHVGYGPNDSWSGVQEMKMFKTGRGWEQTFRVNEPTRLNFCFKDSAANWDNNNGHNWSFEIHHGKTH